MTDPVVLVPLDGSQSALCALPVAKALAELDKAPVRIVHVTEEVGPLSRTAEALRLAPADLRGCALEVRAGKPGEAILAAAADRGATLIVMGAHSGEIEAADALGDTARVVLGGSLCPVVLVNSTQPPSGWTLRRMLAPHDGSPAVSHALRPASELARRAGAELVVLQVAAGERTLETGSIAPPVYVDQLQHSWPAWSAEFLQRLASVCSLADVRVRLLMGHGEPAVETIRVANEEAVDLIALEWKGRLEAPHASTVMAVLRGAPCPVLMTRIPAS
jgi:nucleotide-binding universal stress UspA family protein